MATRGRKSQAFQEIWGQPLRARHARDSGVSRGGGRSSIWCEKRHGWSLERDAACAAADGFATGAAVSQPPATPPSAIFI